MKTKNKTIIPLPARDCAKAGHLYGSRDIWLNYCVACGHEKGK